MAKFSTLLEKRLRDAQPGEILDIVIEVTERARAMPQSFGREERAAAAERQFLNDTEAIAELIQESGGQVLGRTWLGSALKARIPAERIERLRQVDDVEFVDLPRLLIRG
jgi:hypothetical protein